MHKTLALIVALMMAPAAARAADSCIAGPAKMAAGATTLAAGAKALEECMAKTTGPRGRDGKPGESIVGPPGPMGQQGEPGPKGEKGEPGVTTVIVKTIEVTLPQKKEPSPFNLGVGYFISGFGSEDNRDYGAGHGPMFQLNFRMHERVEGVVDIGLPTLFNRKGWSPWKEKGFVVNLATTVYTKKRPWFGVTPVGFQFQGIGFENDQVTGLPKADGLYMMYAPGVAVKLPRRYITYRATATALAGFANFGNDWNSVFGGGVNVSFTPNWTDILGE
jgi:hypothetical protein